jgi:hypothetical protein
VPQYLRTPALAARPKFTKDNTPQKNETYSHAKNAIPTALIFSEV